MALLGDILAHGRQGVVCQTYIVNTMAADDLATQGARSLAAMVLT